MAEDMEYWEGLLQMPDSRPTAKQLASLLNETANTAVGLEASMGGRTFILAAREDAHDVPLGPELAPAGCESREWGRREPLAC